MRRTRLPFIQHRIALHLGNETPVTVAYTTWPVGTAVDPTTQSKVPDETHQPTRTTMTVPAFVHEVKPAEHVVRQYTEVETGDNLVAFAGPVDFSGKEELVFTIHGRDWVQKPISHQLAEYWSGQIMGQRLFRVFLLRKAT